MIIDYDRNPSLTPEQMIKSLAESVQRAFNAIDGSTITGSIDGSNVRIVNIGDRTLQGTVNGDYLFVKNLDADSINSTDAWIDKLMVQTELLAHEGTVFTLDAIRVNAANITAGTIDVERLVVTDAATGKKHMITWNSTTQQWVAAYLDGNVIEDRTLAANKIIANSITVDEITVNNLVGTGGWINLASGTFEYANATTHNGISWDGTNLNVSATQVKIGSGSTYLTLESKEDLISQINLAANTVKIDAAHLNISGVITAINADGTTTIDGGKITANSITGNQIAAATITGNKLDIAGVITSINNDSTTTISGGKITTGSITSSQLAARTIQATDIAAGTITANEINMSTLSIGKMAYDSTRYAQITSEGLEIHGGTTGSIVARLISLTADGSSGACQVNGTYSNQQYRGYYTGKSLSWGLANSANDYASIEFIPGSSALAPSSGRNCISINGGMLEAYMGKPNDSSDSAAFIGSHLAKVGTGSAGKNHGVYSNYANKWIVYTDDTGASGKVKTTLSGFDTGSDRKRKNVLGEIDYAEDFVMSLKPVQFAWKEDTEQKVNLGFIAQDVASLNEAFDIDFNIASAEYADVGGEYKGEPIEDEKLNWFMDYNELIAPIVKVVQEQQKRIEALERRLA